MSWKLYFDILDLTYPGLSETELEQIRLWKRLRNEKKYKEADELKTQIGYRLSDNGKRIKVQNIIKI